MSVVVPRHRDAVAPADAWVAYQKQPLSAGLLQATLLDVFRRSSSLAPAPTDHSTDRAAAELVDGLIGQAIQHQAVQHPYLHALGSGNLPDLPFALRDLARHYGGYVRFGSRFLETLTARLEDPAHRASMQQRLAREMGVVAPASVVLFQRFRSAVGAEPTGTVDPVAIEVMCWREQLLALIGGGSVAEAVGALLLGTEAIQPTIARPVLEAVGRVGLDPRAAAFFAVPAAAIEPLPMGLRRIAIDLARTPQGRLELAKGMHKALGLRAAFWAWLHQRSLSLSAMQG